MDFARRVARSHFLLHPLCWTARPLVRLIHSGTLDDFDPLFHRDRARCHSQAFPRVTVLELDQHHLRSPLLARLPRCAASRLRAQRRIRILAVGRDDYREHVLAPEELLHYLWAPNSLPDSRHRVEHPQ